MFLDRFLYLLVCAYIILLPLLPNKMALGRINIPPADCILALILFGYFVKLLTSKECRIRFFSGIRNFLTNYLTIFMSILAIMMLVSVSYAVDKKLALSESFRFISYIILFFMIKYE